MDLLSSLIAWCTLQVSLVALAGIAASLVFARRNPLAACSLVCTATLVATLLTFLAPFPAHRWFVQETPSTALAAPQSLSGNDQTEVDDDSSQHASSIPMFDASQLAASLRSLAVNVDRFEQRRGSVVHTAVWLLAAMILMGFLQLAAGIAFVWRLRRSSQPIADVELLNLLREVSARLGCSAVPELRESREFTDAAVAGWRQPTVILPSDWRNWCDDERRTVLAHEVAHIVRHDVGWRAAASSLLAFHFYNPVVHWLLRRLMLCQELATDELAAAAVGPRCYLRSLSSLALRQDDQFRRSVSPAVLPVFSGHLIRRITMLNSRTVSPSRRRSLATALISAALLALGLATVATRGLAEPPSGEKPQTTGTAKQVTFTNLVVTNNTIVDPTRDMFRRAPIDPSIVGATNPHGMFAVRLKGLLNRPEFQVLLPLMNTAIAQALEQGLKTTSAPTIQLETIEWIAARPIVTCKKAPADKEKEETDDDSERKTQLMFGAGAFAIKLTQPLDLKAWVEKFAPTTMRHTIEGKDVFQWQLPAMGPQPLYIWMQDETTLRMNYLTPEKITPETRLADLLDDAQSKNVVQQPSAEDANTIPWTATWQRIDSGLVSVVLAQADLSGLFFDFENRKDFQTETLDAVERALRALKSRCRSTACSLDLTEAPSQLGLRVSLTHSSHEASLLSAEDLRELLKQSQTFLESLEADPTNIQGDVHREKALRLVCVLIDSATISVETYDDQTAAVVLSSTMPFQRLTELILPEATGK